MAQKWCTAFVWLAGIFCFSLSLSFLARSFSAPFFQLLFRGVAFSRKVRFVLSRSGGKKRETKNSRERAVQEKQRESEQQETAFFLSARNENMNPVKENA